MEELDMIIAPGLDLPESALAEICGRYEIKELMLFGSAVRGEMRPDSDIDLLVEFLPESTIDLLDHIAAERELTQLLGRKVDLVSKRGLRERLRKGILAEARSIYAA
jgi:predicted nucleotidyltransferase